MKKILTLTVAITLALSGCVTTGTLSPFGKPSTAKPEVSAEQKAEARKGAFRAGSKGCVIGAATNIGMAVVGKFLGWGGKVDPSQLVATCVVAGGATAFQAYQSQLADFRALQGKVTVGAVMTVEEKEIQVKGKPAKGGYATLTLDPEKVAAKHRDIQAVVSELAKTLNKQSVATTVGVSGSATDRAWLVGLLKAQLTNKQVQLNEAHGVAPVLVVSPMPVAN